MQSITFYPTSVNKLPAKTAIFFGSENRLPVNNAIPPITPAMENWVKQFMKNPEETIKPIMDEVFGIGISNTPLVPMEVKLIVPRLPEQFERRLLITSLSDIIQNATQNHWETGLGKLMRYAVLATESGNQPVVTKWFNYLMANASGIENNYTVSTLFPKLDRSSQLQFLNSEDAKKYGGNLIELLEREKISLPPLSKLIILEHGCNRSFFAGKCAYDRFSIIFRHVESIKSASKLDSKIKNALRQRLVDLILRNAILEKADLKFLFKYEFQHLKFSDFKPPKGFEYLEQLKKATKTSELVGILAGCIKNDEIRQEVLDSIQKWKIKPGSRQSILQTMEKIEKPPDYYTPETIKSIKQLLAGTN